MRPTGPRFGFLPKPRNAKRISDAERHRNTDLKRSSRKPHTGPHGIQEGFWISGSADEDVDSKPTFWRVQPKV